VERERGEGRRERGREGEFERKKRVAKRRGGEGRKKERKNTQRARERPHILPPPQKNT
jgi:hypothetical protein